jgi:hypothetical protein
VQTPPAPGSDPTPQALDRVEVASEDASASWGDRGGENDDRLKQDKPPHY